MALGKRVKEARKVSGMTQGDLAKKVGMTQAAIHALVVRDSKSSRKLLELAAALKVDMVWLSNGVNHSSGIENNSPGVCSSTTVEMEESNLDSQSIGFENSPSNYDDEVKIPIFSEVKLADRSILTKVIKNPQISLRFSKSMLRRAGVEEDKAAFAIVPGNSMSSELPDGSIVGLDTHNIQVVEGKLYALDHDGMLRIELLYGSLDGGLRLVPFNHKYPVEEYPADYVARNILILGRVFWSSKLW